MAAGLAVQGARPERRGADSLDEAMAAFRAKWDACGTER